MRRRRLAALATGLVAVCLVAPLLGAQSVTVLVEDWSKQPAGKTGIPDGWQGQSWGSPKYEFSIVKQSSSQVLLMKSEGDSSTISKEIEVDVRQYPILQWSWQIVTLPKGGDARKAATDDEAGQIYITFPRFPKQVRSRIISYIWDTTAPAGSTFKSEKTSLVTYVVIRSGAAEAGKWITETRNVYEDYRRIYGEPPAERAGLVSLSIDSNDTRSTAEAYFGEILFRKP